VTLAAVSGSVRLVTAMAIQPITPIINHPIHRGDGKRSIANATIAPATIIALSVRMKAYCSDAPVALPWISALRLGIVSASPLMDVIGPMTIARDWSERDARGPRPHARSKSR